MLPLLPRILTPGDLLTYSKCSNLWHYSSITEPSAGPDSQLVSIIKNLYVLSLKRDKLLSWKEVIALVDTWLFPASNIVPPTEAELVASKKISEQIYKFYEQFYLKQNYSIGYPNLPISVWMDQARAKLVAELDLLLVSQDGQLNIVSFSQLASSVSQLYNSISTRTTVWMTSQAIKTSAVPHWTHIALSDKGTFSSVVLRSSKKDMEVTKKTVDYLVYGIVSGTRYPAVSEQCQLCPYLIPCSHD